MRFRRGPVRIVGAVCAVAAAVVAGVVASPDGRRTVEAVADVPMGSGGEFQEIEPSRILDTRQPGYALSGPIATSASTDGDGFVDIPVVGEGGLPEFDDSVTVDGFDDNVLAVVVNVTVVRPSRAGYLRAFGSGTPEGTTSVVNFSAGQTVANSAILRPGENGEVSVRIVTPDGDGTAHLVVDVTGWYSTSRYETRGARTVTIEPSRIYDSRDAEYGAEAFGPSTQRTLTVRGVSRMGDPSAVVVPDDEAVVGLVVNLTGVNRAADSEQTFVSILADPVADIDEVTTSNLNLRPGDVRANLAIVPVPDDGELTVFNAAGSTQVVIDVVGYLLADQDVDTRTGRIVPLVAPFRAFDTREAEHFAQRLGPARAEDWSFDAFVGDVSIDGDPVGSQQGLIGNLTATGLQRQYPWAPVQTYLTAYPSPANQVGGPPNISNLNLGEGVAVPNMAMLRYGSTSDGDHQIAVYNQQGYIHYLLDVYAVVLS